MKTANCVAVVSVMVVNKEGRPKIESSIITKQNINLELISDPDVVKVGEVYNIDKVFQVPEIKEIGLVETYLTKLNGIIILNVHFDSILPLASIDAPVYRRLLKLTNEFLKKHEVKEN